eukprot:1753027-Rhodomonas_salina.2
MPGTDVGFHDTRRGLSRKDILGVVPDCTAPCRRSVGTEEIDPVSNYTVSKGLRELTDAIGSAEAGKWRERFDSMLAGTPPFPLAAVLFLGAQAPFMAAVLTRMARVHGGAGERQVHHRRAHAGGGQGVLPQARPEVPPVLSFCAICYLRLPFVPSAISGFLLCYLASQAATGADSARACPREQRGQPPASRLQGTVISATCLRARYAVSGTDRCRAAARCRSRYRGHGGDGSEERAGACSYRPSHSTAIALRLQMLFKARVRSAMP